MSSTAVPGVAEPEASGSQVCTGHNGALIAKAMKNPQNIRFSRPASMGSPMRSGKKSVGEPRTSAAVNHNITSAASITKPPTKL